MSKRTDYKVRDRILNVSLSTAGNLNKGKKGTVSEVRDLWVQVKYDDGNIGESSTPEKDYKIIKKHKNLFMSLQEIVSGLFKTEPQKSRERAGIVDSSNLLTEEGKDIYLNYLLSNDKTFDADIVAPVIAVMDKESK